MDLITIFGSCRQTCVKNHTNVSDILDELNYPHYSKEILQEIKYLKYRNIPDSLTKYCFRDGLLSNCRIEISNDKYNRLKKQFDNTTVFLIEIASRISYKWNNLYLHHIAEDSKYNFYDRNNIIKKDITDEEIEEDIIQIKNELYPKPFIIISHFATYSHGKRYELTQLLSKICKKMNIPFINQSDIINIYGINMLVKEPVLAHYTSEALQIVGRILMSKINEIKELKKSSKKELYQVYYTSHERVKKYTFHGLGDYIRGCIHLYQLYNDKVNLKINFSNHNLSKLFICDNHVSIENSENAKYIFSSGENFLNWEYVFTNNFYVGPKISDDCKNFIIKNCLTPTIYFENKLLSLKKSMGLENNNYSVIQIRLNDKEVYDNYRYNRIVDILENIKNKNSDKKFLLISSNDIYINKIDIPLFLKTNLSRGHVGLNTTSLKECEDTMLEFMLMVSSNDIHQLSVYGWGSGFSDIISALYDKPLIKYKI